jgi:hypothetical protein
MRRGAGEKTWANESAHATRITPATNADVAPGHPLERADIGQVLLKRAAGFSLRGCLMVDGLQRRGKDRAMKPAARYGDYCHGSAKAALSYHRVPDMVLACVRGGDSGMRADGGDEAGI